MEEITRSEYPQGGGFMKKKYIDIFVTLFFAITLMMGSTLAEAHGGGGHGGGHGGGGHHGGGHGGGGHHGGGWGHHGGGWGHHGGWGHGRYYWHGGYYNYYYNGVYYVNCNWVPAHWSHGVWYPARRVCW